MELNKIDTELQELSIIDAKEIHGGNVMHTLRCWISRAFCWVTENNMPPSTSGFKDNYLLNVENYKILFSR